MQFDVVLPLIVSAIITAMVLLHENFEAKIKLLFEEREFAIRDAVFLVIAMGTMVTVLVFIPQQAIQILFLVAYSAALFIFTFVTTEKWYFAVIPPVVFLALYFSPFWNIVLLNLFAIIFVISISLYLGGLFSWRTVLAFAALITAMDVVQVFVTGFMGASTDKLIELKLPILIEVPTFPLVGHAIRLGLGDLFLAGLLAIQTSKKYGRKAGFVSSASFGIAFLVFEFLIMNFEFAGYFPATLVVMGGWLLGLGISLALKQKRSS